MDTNTGIRFLTKEGIESGRNPLTETDLTFFNVYAPEYRNLKYLGKEDLPFAIARVPVLAGVKGVNFSIVHGLGYRPLAKVYFEDIDGNILQVPAVSADAENSCCIFNQSIDEDNSLSFSIGANNMLNPAGMSQTHIYNIYYHIFIDPDRGAL